MIHISLSPNLEPDDVLLAQKWLISPRRWSAAESQKKLLFQLKKSFPAAREIFLFNSGRSALMVGLKALNLPPNTEVLLQAFTCSAVPNSIIWNQLKSKYLDIGPDDYNFDPKNLPASTASDVAKVLIIQHTFGQPADLTQIMDYCKKNQLFLIEDCAHSLGAKFQGKPIGSFGDLAILSFGRDKVISSVFGGALIINNPKLVKAVSNLYQKLPYPPNWWTCQQLLHPLFTSVALKTYDFYLGKLLLWAGQKLKLISKAIYPQEKHGRVPAVFPTKLPEPLAALASRQLEKLDRFNKKRQEIARYYDKNIKNPLIIKPKYHPESIYLRYTIRLDQPEELKKFLAKKKIIIEKFHWYRQPIVPVKNLQSVDYSPGQCPQAEKACLQCLNLPTHPRLYFQDYQLIVKLVNQWSPSKA